MMYNVYNDTRYHQNAPIWDKVKTVQLVVLAATLALVIGLTTVQPTAAAGTVPVTTGVVVRGQTVPGNGTTGEKVGGNCENFRSEEVTQTGQLSGASVQCKRGGTVADVIKSLPTRFNAYCVLDAKKLRNVARLIPAQKDGNNEHCDLSAITPDDAVGLFGGAIWR
jgi:hypothetical protein